MSSTMKVDQGELRFRLGAAPDFLELVHPESAALRQESKDLCDGALAKQVYALFGLAAFQSQIMEATLQCIALATARLTADVTWRHEAEQFDAEFSRKTLGAMLRAVRGFTDVDDATANLLDGALERRNRLMHGFFYRHGVDFISNAGKQAMCAELADGLDAFWRANALLETLQHLLSKLIGVTKELYECEYERLRAEAALRDADPARVPVE